MSNKKESLYHHLDALKDKQGFSHLLERIWIKKLLHESKILFGTWNICTIIGHIYGIGLYYDYKEEKFYVPTIK